MSWAAHNLRFADRVTNICERIMHYRSRRISMEFDEEPG